MKYEEIREKVMEATDPFSIEEIHEEVEHADLNDDSRDYMTAVEHEILVRIQASKDKSSLDIGELVYAADEHIWDSFGEPSWDSERHTYIDHYWGVPEKVREFNDVLDDRDEVGEPDTLRSCIMVYAGCGEHFCDWYPSADENPIAVYGGQITPDDLNEIVNAYTEKGWDEENIEECDFDLADAIQRTRPLYEIPPAPECKSEGEDEDEEIIYDDRSCVCKDYRNILGESQDKD